MTIFISLILKNGIREPNFFRIEGLNLIIRQFPYLWEKEIPLSDVKGFSESTKMISI